MSITKQEQTSLHRVADYVQAIFAKEQSGHDFDHIKRVVNLTTRLITSEDAYVALLIAYFHELLDDKLFDITDETAVMQHVWLDLELEPTLFQAVYEGVLSIGYKAGLNKNVKSKEAAVVSDADFLEAMGAIGIGRTFYYAGAKGLPFYEEELVGISAFDYESYRHLRRNSIEHLNEKLLKLKDLMVTEKGRELAHIRHQRLYDFYEAFYEELQEAGNI